MLSPLHNPYHHAQFLLIPQPDLGRVLIGNYLYLVTPLLEIPFLRADYLLFLLENL